MWSNERKRQAIRKVAEQVMHRACFLDPADRALLSQIFEKGVPAHEIARLTGRHVRTVQRRIHALLYRLADPGIEFILRAHASWPDHLADVALLMFVRGRSLRETSQQLDRSLHEIRRDAAIVDGLVDQGTRGGPTRRNVRRLLETVNA